MILYNYNKLFNHIKINLNLFKNHYLKSIMKGNIIKIRINNYLEKLVIGSRVMINFLRRVSPFNNIS